MKFTRQFDQMDCGPSCIRMVASAYGKDYPLSYLRSLSHLTREGVSIAGIRDALQQIGLRSATFEMTFEQLREHCPLPAILHWEQNHFVVLYDVRRSRVTGKWKYYVANPAYGKHTFDEEGMARYWLNGTKGVVIAIEPTEQFDKTQFAALCPKICVALQTRDVTVGSRHVIGHTALVGHPLLDTDHGGRRYRFAQHERDTKHHGGADVYIFGQFQHEPHQ